MDNFCIRALATLFAIWMIVGCDNTEEPPQHVPDAEPLSDPSLPVAPAVDDDRQYDELGRLKEASEMIYNYQTPRGLWLRRASAGLREYELVCSEKALVEFYAHRKYPVIRKGAGYTVLPSSNPPPGIREQEENAVTLHITRTARHRFKLRFFRSEPRNHVPRINQEYLQEREDLSEEQKQQLIRRIRQEQGTEDVKIPGEKAPTPAPVGSPAPRVPAKQSFNPAVRQGQGQGSVQRRVKEWLEKNPGAVFYD